MKTVTLEQIQKQQSQIIRLMQKLDAARDKYNQLKIRMIEDGNWHLYCEQTGNDPEHNAYDIC